MNIDLATAADLKRLEDKIDKLLKIGEILKERIAPAQNRVMWRKEILERLGQGQRFWENNLTRLPVQRAENGRYYCYENELDEWLETGNL